MRLLEARAACKSGQPKDAVAILESLLGPTASGREGVEKAGGKKADSPALCGLRFLRGPV